MRIDWIDRTDRTNRIDRIGKIKADRTNRHRISQFPGAQNLPEPQSQGARSEKRSARWKKKEVQCKVRKKRWQGLKREMARQG